MTVRLTARQEKERINLKTNLKLYVGYYSPQLMRTFEALVKKGYAKVVKDRPGFGKDFVTTEFEIIQTTTMIMGKGIRPGNHTGEHFIWIVTPEALERIKSKGLRFQKVY
jgi:hypothetical protein